MTLYMCVCVCVRERERERERVNCVIGSYILIVSIKNRKTIKMTKIRTMKMGLMIKVEGPKLFEALKLMDQK